MTFSTFQNHNSQPSYALWRQSIRIQIAGQHSPARDARGTGPVAQPHQTALDGSTVAGAASPNMRGPAVFTDDGKPSSVCGARQAINMALEALAGDEKIAAINELRATIHTHSPFRDEPVDFVRWVKNDAVYANDYNPNSVAPPEMELLRLSIDADGYTQPIVSMPDPDGRFEVIDGFHRHRVGKECVDIQARIKGYLPLVTIRETQADKSDRMASTIRHNRARGKHRVEAMSDIVIELKKRNWTDEKIAKNLGMEPDEVLRLCQISGLADLFSDEEFSASWDIDDIDEADLPEELLGEA